MKVIKSRVFQFIITAIIFTGIGVFATTAISADQIQYNSTTTVKDKIDDLYTRQDQRIDQVTSQNGTLTTQNSSLTAQNGILTSQNETLASQNSTLQGQVTTLTSQNSECQEQLSNCSSKNVSFGTASYNQAQGTSGSKSTTLTLSKGAYVVAALDNKATYATSNNTGVSTANLPISCSNGCSIQRLTDKLYVATATTAIYNSNYLQAHLYLNLYYVNVTSNTDTITLSVSPSSNAKVGESLILQAIPINY